LLYKKKFIFLYTLDKTNLFFIKNPSLVRNWLNLAKLLLNNTYLIFLLKLLIHLCWFLTINFLVKKNFKFYNNGFLKVYYKVMLIEIYSPEMKATKNPMELITVL